MDERIRGELLELSRLDEETRHQLVRDGSLFDGYAEAMERVHLANAARLERILDENGWPGHSIAGPDGAEAAWIVAQHAISLPPFQRRCLDLITGAVESGEAPAKHRAYLTDRIRFNEHRPQVYGTVFDWDAEGKMSPWPVEQAESVDGLRADVGFPPLNEEVERMRRSASVEGNRPPQEFEARQQEIRRWARACGWLGKPLDRTS